MMADVIRIRKKAVTQSRNSAVADKPRDASVQMQWRGGPPKVPPPTCYHADFG